MLWSEENKSSLYFKTVTFLILEHWPKFNTDTNMNFLGGQGMSIGNFLDFFLRQNF